MENLCAIPLRLVYIHVTWGSHLTEGHIVLKDLCLLLLVRRFIYCVWVNVPVVGSSIDST
jgi:hypothetical protein